MEVKIGVVYTPKELNIELDGSVDELSKVVEEALEGGRPVLWLTDKRGRRVGIPADKIAYVEMGDDDAAKRVGFGS